MINERTLRALCELLEKRPEWSVVELTTQDGKPWKPGMNEAVIRCEAAPAMLYAGYPENVWFTVLTDPGQHIHINAREELFRLLAEFHKQRVALPLVVN